MQSQNYDDPKVETRWLKEQRRLTQEHLDKEEIRLGDIEERPVWFVAPYVALWKIENLKLNQQVNIWAISGDFPTDHCEFEKAQFPREVLLTFAKRWGKMSEEMLKGNFPSNFCTGKLDDQKELGAL
jgi:hypothetical protein